MITDKSKINNFVKTKPEMRISTAALFFIFLSHFSFGQNLFPEKCIGKWKGTMHIYASGKIRDSVPVKLTVTPKDSRSWAWKTEYLSEKYPMTKDYVVKTVNAATGHFQTDEGDGIVIDHYVFGDKMSCVFETAGILLTSVYELQGGKLIFEVASGKKSEETGEVISHPVTNLQRVVFSKE